MSTLPNAIVLIGPTGVGKTPLGEHLENAELLGRRYGHFDFGEHLRRAAAMPDEYSLLSKEDVEVIRNVLATGALLENHQFHIAENILKSFISRKALEADDCVVLNGLPRHEGQAAKIDQLTTVEKVILLDCDEFVVYERIRTNSGGDRTGRVDDSREEVANKLEIFRKRTRPLVEYYKNKGVPVHSILVNSNSSPEKMRDVLVDMV